MASCFKGNTSLNENFNLPRLQMVYRIKRNTSCGENFYFKVQLVAIHVQLITILVQLIAIPVQLIAIPVQIVPIPVQLIAIPVQLYDSKNEYFLWLSFHFKRQTWLSASKGKLPVEKIISHDSTWLNASNGTLPVVKIEIITENMANSIKGNTSWGENSIFHAST